MTDFQHYHKPDFVAYCQQAVEKYARTYRGVDAVVLATTAGFQIASFASSGLYNRDKLAALASSLFKVGESTIAEACLKNCQSLLLDADNGKVLVSSIRHTEHPVVLLIKVNEKATLGNLIYSAKKLNQQVISYLQDNQN